MRTDTTMAERKSTKRQTNDLHTTAQKTKGNKYLDQFDWTTAVTVFPPFKTSIFGSLVVD